MLLFNAGLSSFLYASLFLLLIDAMSYSTAKAKAINVIGIIGYFR